MTPLTSGLLRALPSGGSAAATLRGGVSGGSDTPPGKIRLAREFVVPETEAAGVAMRTAAQEPAMTAPPGRP
jgi:hypothetical protein